MVYDKALEQLESLLDDPYYMGKIPYKKGNSIRIGHYIIRKNKTGYLVYDCVDNRKVDHFWSKSVALAYAKLVLDGKTLHTELKKLLKTLEKNQIDAMFYRNTIKKASEEIRKSSARVRLDIAEENAYNAKYRLIGLIFDN